MHTHRFQGSRVHAGRGALLLLLLDTETAEQRRDAAAEPAAPFFRFFHSPP